MTPTLGEVPYFTDAERAALALAESPTRLSDLADPVPDEVWDEATWHYHRLGDLAGRRIGDGGRRTPGVGTPCLCGSSRRGAT